MTRYRNQLIGAAVFCGLVTTGALMNSKQAIAQGPSNGLAVRLVEPVVLSPAASVRINNQTSDPVPVKTVGGAQQPVQWGANCSATAGTIGCQPLSYVVPAGKRLVIEYASFNSCTLPGVTANLTISTYLAGAYVKHALPVVGPAAAPGVTNLACNSPSASSLLASGQEVRLYADAQSAVIVQGDRNTTTGITTFQMSFSGHLVDAQ